MSTVLLHTRWCIVLRQKAYNYSGHYTTCCNCWFVSRSVAMDDFLQVVKLFLKIRKSTNSAFYCKNRTCTCDVFHRGCELVLWLSHAVLFQFVSSNRKPSIYKKQRTGRIHILLPKVSRTANRFLNLGTWRRLCAISRTAVPNCSGRHCWSGHFAEEKKSSCSSLSPQASHPYYNQISFSGREKKQAIHPF